MNKIITQILALALAVTVIACSSSTTPAPDTKTGGKTTAPTLVTTTDTIKDPPTFTKGWEVTGLEGPESVVFDATTNSFYVSNVTGADPAAKDGEGYISKISADGKTKEKWLTGLNSPKGLGIYEGKLYVADVTDLHEINISDKAKTTYAASGSTFLNDIVIDGNGLVFISNTFGGTGNFKIYQFNTKATTKAVTEWLQNDSLNRPNGLYIDGGNMYVANWGEGNLDSSTFATDELGSILMINISTKAIETVASRIGNLDGIAKISTMGYLATDWRASKLFYYSNSYRTATKILDFPASSGSADISYIDSKKMLFVPLMNQGKLIQYTANTIDTPTIEKGWEVTGLEGPESVVFDTTTNSFYVSNVTGADPAAKDGEGYISKISADGKTKEKWLTGLNSPKGLGIYEGKLYVADVTDLHEINISDKAKTTYAAPGATFLNDIAIDGDGVAYISNTFGGTGNFKIYQFNTKATTKVVTEWLQNDSLNRPNGLYIDGGNMYVANWGEGNLDSSTFATDELGSILMINMSSKAITTVASRIGNLDGIAKLTTVGYLATDWRAAKLFYYSNKAKSTTRLFDFPAGSGSADIGYVESKKMLFVPLMNQGKLAQYNLK